MAAVDDLLSGQPPQDDGSWETLPPFANEEHQKMFAVVKQEKIELEKLKAEAIENEERVAIMAEHLKNVQQELHHSQVLYYLWR